MLKQTGLLCAHMAFNLGYHQIVLVKSNAAWRAIFSLKTSKKREPYQLMKTKVYNIMNSKTQTLYILVFKTINGSQFFEVFSEFIALHAALD